MEIAVTVILAAGIRAVLAKTFSRTFYRNAVNNGLIPIECETAGIAEGDRLSIDVAGGAIEVKNLSTATSIAAKTLPALMTEILSAGSIVEFVKRGGWNRLA